MDSGDDAFFKMLKYIARRHKNPLSKAKELHTYMILGTQARNVTIRSFITHKL
jgi:hypothetical protein